MKRCPACNRTYSDDTQSFCLDDGSVLTPAYDAQPTMRIPTPRGTDPPPTQAAPDYYYSPPQATKRRWPIFLAITLLVLVLGGGAIAFAFLNYYSRSPTSSSSENANDSVSQVANATPTANLHNETRSKIAEPSPSSSPSPASEARQLVGVWRSNVHHENDDVEITYTFTADGRSTMLFKHSDGSKGSDYGTWQYSDGILFERFSNGASGKGSIRWIDDDHFEITIIDNGIPADSAAKRRYRRVS